MEYLIKHGLRVGNNFHCFSPYAFDAHWPWLITVGDDVVISADVRILAHDASPNRVRASTKIGCVSIGNNVFVGAGTTILCNVRIGDNVIVGAGSVVTHDIPDNSVAAGNTARVIGSFEDYRRKHQDNLKTHKRFTEHAWDDWKNASPEEWQEMRDQLRETYGYV